MDARWIFLLAPALAASAPACSGERRVVEINLRTENGIAFVAMLDAEGRLERVSDPFAVDQGALRFGEIPVFTFERGTAVLVRFDDRDLPIGTRLDLLDGSIAVGQGAPPARPQIRPSSSPDVRSWSGALPAQAKIYDVAVSMNDVLVETDPRALEIRANTTLTVPIELEHCRAPSDDALVHFADLEPMDAPCPLAYQGTFDLVPDGEHVLIVSAHSLAWVARGQSLSTCVPAEPEYFAHGYTGAMGVFRAAARVAPGRFLAASIREDGSSGLFEFSVVAGRLTITSSIAFDDLKIEDVAVDEAGTFAISGGTTGPEPEGIVIFGELTGGAIMPRERHVQPRGTPNHDERALIIPAPGGGWLVLRPNTVYRYKNSSWSASSIDGAVFYYAIAARQRPSGELEVWVSGEKGHLFYQSTEGGPFTSFSYERPAEFTACSNDNAGTGYVFDRRIRDLTIAGDHLFVVIQDCGAVAEIALRDDGPDRTCAAFLPVADASELLGPFMGLGAIVLESGELRAAGDDSKVRSARLR